jgi:hypothetical protein
MIDTQQQYINLNIRGEISIIVVQAHSGIIFLSNVQDPNHAFRFVTSFNAIKSSTNSNDMHSYWYKVKRIKTIKSNPL